MSVATHLTVEKGIGIPECGVRRRSGRSKYPWDQMGIGDSFLAASDDADVIAAAIWRRTRKQRRGVVERYVTRKLENGIRVWRIA